MTSAKCVLAMYKPRAHGMFDTLLEDMLPNCDNCGDQLCKTERRIEAVAWGTRVVVCSFQCLCRLYMVWKPERRGYGKENVSV